MSAAGTLILAFPPVPTQVGRMHELLPDLSLETGRALDQRREILSAFADEIPLAFTPSRRRALASSETRMPSPCPMVILEALGILLVDGQVADQARIEAFQGGPQIVPNARVVRVESNRMRIASEDKSLSEDIPRRWHLDETFASDAWGRGLEGEGVLIGILDESVTPDHEEIAGRVVKQASFDGCGSELAPSSRRSGHGTSVCGLAAGKCYGMARKAQLCTAEVLMPKADNLNKVEGTLAQFLAGLDWLLKGQFRGKGNRIGVDVINASLAFKDLADPQQLFNILERALRPRVLFVAPVDGVAGQAAAPGSFHFALSVGGYGLNHLPFAAGVGKAFPPNSPEPNQKPDLYAPGEHLYAAGPAPCIFNTPDGQSFSSALVAGTAALLLSGQPDLKDHPQQVKELLMAKGKRSSGAFNRLDARRA